MDLQTAVLLGVLGILVAVLILLPKYYVPREDVVEIDKSEE